VPDGYHYKIVPCKPMIITKEKIPELKKNFFKRYEYLIKEEKNE